MKKLLFAFAIATMGLGFTSCDEDEKVTPKDYGMKTFKADMDYTYIPDPSGGMGTAVYAQQTYFKFGEESAIATGKVDTDSWTQFNIYDYAAKGEEVPDGYVINKTADVDGWELVFTNYKGTTYMGNPEGSPYNLTGVLFNAEAGITVAEKVYDESEKENDIAAAFASLVINDVKGLTYSEEVETIGSDWKSLDWSTKTYVVKSNNFYVIKMANGDYYKLRFLSFYGETTSERIIKIEYALVPETIQAEE